MFIRIFILFSILIGKLYSGPIPDRYDTIPQNIVKLAEQPTLKLLIKYKQNFLELGCKEIYKDSLEASKISEYLNWIRYHVNQNKKGIQDPIIYATVVSALGTKYADYIIRNYSRYDYVFAFTEYLKNHSEFRNDEEFIIRFDLTEDEKKEILTTTKSTLVKAAFGDSTAESYFIENFTTETDFYRKAELCKKLGAIGTGNSIKALLKGLEDTLYITGYCSKMSIRFVILIALRRCFPKEELFKGINRMFDFPLTNKQYKERLTQWAKENYNVELDLPEDFYIEKATCSFKIHEEY